MSLQSDCLRFGNSILSGVFQGRLGHKAISTTNITYGLDSGLRHIANSVRQHERAQTINYYFLCRFTLLVVHQGVPFPARPS